MEKTNILEVNNLNVKFRSANGIVHAVKDLSFKIKAGSTLAVVGESGSGKSVTSMTLLRLLNPESIHSIAGNIYFQDRKQNVHELLTLEEKQHRKLRGSEIAMIFQEPMTALNPVYTCGYQVAEALETHTKFSKAQIKEKTISLFNEVLLPDPERIWKSYPHELSGGQRQRVMIAMALSADPSLLIADEPTTALDVTTQNTILELIQQLQAKRGMSMIFISHDLSVVSDIADEVLVMYKGQMMEYGAAEQIFQKPVSPYTKGLLACRPSNKPHSGTLPVMSDFMKEDEKGEVAHHIPVALKEEDFDLPLASGKKGEVFRLENISKSFPSKKNFLGKVESWFKSVDNVSLTVNRGECLGLVGESGSGKTTLSRLMLRLIDPSSGHVILDDVDISALRQKDLKPYRRDIQIIFQDPYSSLNPRHSIGYSIIEPMEVHGILNHKNRKQKAIELLKKVNLDPAIMNRYPHELSGGQRQRVCIARCLALSPEFIICDESVSALDVSVQAQVLNLLKELQKDFNLTYIFITHDLKVVRYMADRIAVMKSGKIEELAETEKLFRSPESDYTKKLLSAIRD